MAFRLADDELDASDSGAVQAWADEARDLIQVSREIGLSGLADSLEDSVEVLEADSSPATVTLFMPLAGEAMNGYLAYCDPYADDYFGGEGY